MSAERRTVVLLTTNGALKKLSKSRTWLHDRVKDDPDFPRPIYLDSHPSWIESDLDDWLQKMVDQGK